MIATYVFEKKPHRLDAAMQVWSNKDPSIAKRVRKATDMR
jgi:hypothetical protein